MTAARLAARVEDAMGSCQDMPLAGVARFHAALRERRDLRVDWDVKYLGEQDDGEGGVIILFNCPRCNTTLSVESSPK